MNHMSDWMAWHRDYEDPSSSLSARLRRVHYHLSQAIDRAPGDRSAWSASARGRAAT
jgi:hypothetical protein